MTKSANNKVTNEYTTEQKIVFLFELQKISSKIDEINFIKGELPTEVADLEDEVEGLKTRLANISAKIDELSKSSKASKESSEEAKALIAKYGGIFQNGHESPPLRQAKPAALKVVLNVSPYAKSSRSQVTSQASFYKCFYCLCCIK